MLQLSVALAQCICRFANQDLRFGKHVGCCGEFEIDLGIVTRVRATELSLANTAWGSEPTMASIDRLDGEINLWELLSGSIPLPSVDIEGGRAIFESDDESGRD